MGRREEKKAEKRDRIRRAAFELFTERGYEATTTKAVAERAGIATGTLFLYAKDKPDLLFLVLHERVRTNVDESLATVPRPAPLIEQLMHIFRRLFAMYDEHPDIARELLKALPGADGPNARAMSAYTVTFLTQLAGLVQEGQASGDLASDIDPMLAASNVFFLYYGSLLNWLNGWVDLESALDPGLRRALELQIRGLAARG